MALFDNWQSEQYVEPTYSQNSSQSTGKKSSLNFAAIALGFLSFIVGIIRIAFTPTEIYQAGVNISYLLSLFPQFQFSQYTSASNFNKYDPNYVNYTEQVTIRALHITNIVGISLYCIVTLLSIFLLFKKNMNTPFALLYTFFGLFSFSVTLALSVISPVNVTLSVIFIISIAFALISSWVAIKKKE